MKTIPHSLLVTLATISLSGMQALLAADTDPKVAEVTKTAGAFVEAFHKGDAKAVAAFWTPDGDFVDVDGRVFKGRKAIEDSFTEFFADNKGLKLRMDVVSIKFPTPDMAVEDGTTTLMASDGSAP